MNSFSAADYSVLVRLLLVYVLTRFALRRGEPNFRSLRGYVNAALTSGLTVLLLNNYTVKSAVAALLLGLTQALIQNWKASAESTTQNFLLREGLFILVLTGVWLWLVGGRPDVAGLLESPGLLILLTGYLLAVFPLGQLISLATKTWREEIKSSDQNSLANAGKWIGIFERILILTFVLLDQYSAIGLLIAAKSILRFNDKGSDETLQKRTEYILIGTLLSFALALLLGLAMKALLEKT